jgi:hypothetical protein
VEEEEEEREEEEEAAKAEAEKKEEIQCRSSACSQLPPYQAVDQLERGVRGLVLGDGYHDDMAVSGASSIHHDQVRARFAGGLSLLRGSLHHALEGGVGVLSLGDIPDVIQGVVHVQVAQVLGCLGGGSLRTTSRTAIGSWLTCRAMLIQTRGGVGGDSTSVESLFSIIPHAEVREEEEEEIRRRWSAWFPHPPCL